jgi:hypothetical protein
MQPHEAKGYPTTDRRFKEIEVLRALIRERWPAGIGLAPECTDSIIPAFFVSAPGKPGEGPLVAAEAQRKGAAEGRGRARRRRSHDKGCKFLPGPWCRRILYRIGSSTIE